jgi:RNA-directed DNA polymerase
MQGYYQSIDHTILIKQLEQQVPDQDLIALLTQVIRRTVEWGGTFKIIKRGVDRGSPLSPLFAAVYLKPLDDAMDQAGLNYVRYMDDWVVLNKTRWQLRRAVVLVNRTLAALKLEKHPDKTWVGKIDRGVDFLGYHHTRAGSCLSGCSPRR